MLIGGVIKVEMTSAIKNELPIKTAIMYNRLYWSIYAIKHNGSVIKINWISNISMELGIFKLSQNSEVLSRKRINKRTTFIDKITTVFIFLIFLFRPYFTVPIRALIIYFLLRIKKANANPQIIRVNNKFIGIGNRLNKTIFGTKLIIMIPK